MPSQQPRKTKRLRESVTRADLMVLARAVDQSIADLRAELDARNADMSAATRVPDEALLLVKVPKEYEKDRLRPMPPGFAERGVRMCYVPHDWDVSVITDEQLEHFGLRRVPTDSEGAE